ncbi:hypothetical protein ES705_22277 [subsurface metagenome]
MKYISAIVVCIALLTGCTNRGSFPSTRTARETDFVKEDIRYAKGFTIEKAGDHKLITVFNPWSSPDTLATYHIYYNDSIKDPLSEFKIKIPINKIACLSSTNIGMISLLGDRKKISACSDPDLIYDSLLYQRYLDGQITDLGSANQFTVETIVDHSPDLVMKYIFGARETVDEKLIEANIPVAYNLEFMEIHPLGRVEWLKFVAAFLGKEKTADSLFDSIEDEYLRLVELVSKETVKPSVLDGSSYRGVWYAAGGKSYSAKMYADAGADYYWSADNHRGSIPVSFEIIIDKQADADFWFGPSTGNRTDLLEIEKRYNRLKSFREGNVYFFGKRVNPNGGLDYFESGVARPDILLKDLIWVFHPELLDSNYNSVYLEKIH